MRIEFHPTGFYLVFKDGYECECYELANPDLFIGRIGYLANWNGYENALCVQETLGM